MNQLESSIEEEEKNRSSYLRLAREAVRKRREKIAIQDAKDESNASTEANDDNDVETILSLLRNNGDELEMYSKLHRLIEKNASDIEFEVNSIRHNTNLLKKRIAGYTNLLDETKENGGIVSQ